MKDEEIFPFDDPYTWTETSDIPIDDFLSKYKPSMVQNDGTKPWLWIRVTRPGGGGGIPSDERKNEALEKASELLKEATDIIETIKNDDSIPARSSKKTGTKGKKEVREECQKEYTQKLKDLSQEHGYTNGKWLLFAPADRVDNIWFSLAKSINTGPLASTPITVAKVATSPVTLTPNYQHVICLYIPDVYDKESVEATMRVLLRSHGVNLSGVKSDLYTLIGIDSKHPSGMQSTIWRNTDIIKDEEIKELKAAFFAEKEGSGSNAKAGVKISKPKADDGEDPFASDNEDTPATESKPKPEVKSAKPKSKSKPDPKPTSKEGDTKEKTKGKKVVKRVRDDESSDDEPKAKVTKKFL